MLEISIVAEVAKKESVCSKLQLMYPRKNRISAHKQGRMIEHFVAGSTARAAAEIAKLKTNAAAIFVIRLRQLIAVKWSPMRIISADPV